MHGELPAALEFPLGGSAVWAVRRGNSLAAVLRPFLGKDGTIIRIPARSGKRRLLLEYIVAAFEPGVRLPEREVDAVLRAFYEVDWVSLRRYLIDAGLMEREDGIYWRTGGYVDV